MLPGGFRFRSSGHFGGEGSSGWHIFNVLPPIKKRHRVYGGWVNVQSDIEIAPKKDQFRLLFNTLVYSKHGISDLVKKMSIN